VTSLVLLKDYDPMLLAVAIEEKSAHPLAAAIISDFCGCIVEAAAKTFPTVRKLKAIEGVGELRTATIVICLSGFIRCYR
jgi:cation transport ATPase